MRIARRSASLLGVRRFRAASMLVKYTPSRRVTRRPASTALNVSRKPSSASSAALIWIVSVLAIYHPRDPSDIRHEILEELVDIRKSIGFLDALNMPVVPLRR